MSGTLADLVPIRARVFMHARFARLLLIWLQFSNARPVTTGFRLQSGKKLFRPITLRAEIEVNQSHLEAKTCSCRQARTNACEHFFYFLLIGQVFDTSEGKHFPARDDSCMDLLRDVIGSTQFLWKAWDLIANRKIVSTGSSSPCSDNLSSYYQQLHHWNSHVCYSQLRSPSCRWRRWSAVAVRFQKLSRKTPYNVVVKYDLNRAYRSSSEFSFQLG